MLLKLEAQKTAHSHRGVIKHADVIGKEPRQLVQSSKGASYRIHEPTLADYVRLTPRLVTPVRVLFILPVLFILTNRAN
jgi:tRNA (adenine57-N1/adenine58-N1)-methyltransferase